MSFLAGLLVGIVLTSGSLFVLDGRKLRQLKKEYEDSNARYQRAMDDLEALMKRAVVASRDGKEKVL
jgi:hypothetical protein